MRKSAIAALIVTTFLPFAPIAGAQPKAAAIGVGEAEALLRVESIDRKARTVNVRTPSGATAVINVPPEAQNLDQVKVGDVFRMRYAESVAIALSKGGAASASEMQTVELAPKGGIPGGKAVNTRQITAVVTGIDRGARTLTVQGPRKNSVVLKVAPEVKSFDETGIGDTITLMYTEALALEMVKQTKAASDKKAK